MVEDRMRHDDMQSFGKRRSGIWLWPSSRSLYSHHHCFVNASTATDPNSMQVKWMAEPQEMANRDQLVTGTTNTGTKPLGGMKPQHLTPTDDPASATSPARWTIQGLHDNKHLLTTTNDASTSSALDNNDTPPSLKFHFLWCLFFS
jgi:hypothetical protein